MIVSSFYEFKSDYSNELEDLYYKYINYRNKHTIWPDLTYNEFILFIYDYSQPFYIPSNNQPYLQLNKSIQLLHINDIIDEFIYDAYDIYIIQEALQLRTEMMIMIDDLPFFKISCKYSPWLKLLNYGYYTYDYILNMVKNMIIKSDLPDDEYDICYEFFKETSYSLPSRSYNEEINKNYDDVDNI